MQKFKRIEERYSKFLYGLFIVILITGLVLRIYQHFMGRSLWEDETHFALNFIKYDYWRLTKPLDDIQAGPLFFLWGVKTFVEIFGYNEIAFRSLTWLISISAFPLFYFIALELTRRRIIALLSFLLFTVNIAVIYYSSELKPYGIDASFYLIITYLTISKNNYVANKRHKLLAIAGILGILLSNTAFLILFCSALYIFYNWYHEKRIDKRYILTFALWAVVFLANYYIFIHNHPATEQQRLNYAFGFSPFPALNCEFATFLNQRLSELFFYMLMHIWDAYYFAYVIALLILVATWHAVKNKMYGLLMFTWLPIMCFFMLSVMHIYPFWYRLILTTVPCFFILLAYGTVVIAGYLADKVHILLGWMFILICTFFFTRENIRLYPEKHIDIKQSLDFINNNVADSTRIYITTPINAYKYYKFRGIIKDTTYEALPWEMSPEEFYYIVSKETQPFVMLYHSHYPGGGYETVIKDLHNKELIIKEFESRGYIVNIIKPMPAPISQKVITPADFNDPNDVLPLYDSKPAESKSIELQAGEYEFYIVSYGTKAGGEFPLNSVYINDSKIGTFTSTALRSFSQPMLYSQTTDGPINIRIIFENDYYADGEDRNAFIDRLLIVNKSKKPEGVESTAEPMK